MIATCLLFIVYLLLFSPQFALAAELDLTFSNHDEIELAYGRQEEVDAPEGLELRSATYEPEFALFDRSIIGRVAENVVSMEDNEVKKSNIAPDASMTYVFQSSSVSSRQAQKSHMQLELRNNLNTSQEPDGDKEEEDDDDTNVAIDPELAPRATSSSTLWISANTCEQPWAKSDQTTAAPPQLTLYVSTSSDNTSPGPAQTSGQEAIPFTEGAVMYNTTLDRDVYMSVYAPNVSSDSYDTTREYNFELVASTEQYYFSYRDDGGGTDLVWVDSDASAAFLQTNYLTNSSDQVLTTMPYVIFAHNSNNTIINGMRNSYCGLSSYAQVRNLADGTNGLVTMGMKQGGDKNLTRQEFYVSGLNVSSDYIAILAKEPGKSSQKRQDDSSSVGGGIVFQPTNFSTKSSGACTFIFNLTLCDETQYAVPGNLKNFPNGTALAAFYESYTQTMWDNFDKVLQQVPCEADSTAKYSLARDCDDCKQSYKNWLCSVAVPRCEDFSTLDRDYLQMRNIGAPFPNGTTVDQKILEKFGNLKPYNSSRNPSIDEVVQPGPYKEVLPCEDLCYELVQSCPASLGFTCPNPESVYGFKTSYGRKSVSNSLSCNYPGSAHYPSDAGTQSPPWFGLAILAGVVLMLAV
ncbi:hypothetical protein M426DRAFT_319512 [Hypoxylon sp. CI-4A]|nr:hypothetical protein M426DRAFT_319512 [Hypoxylon sp. CI-4A]